MSSSIDGDRSRRNSGIFHQGNKQDHEEHRKYACEHSSWSTSTAPAATVSPSWFNPKKICSKPNGYTDVLKSQEMPQSISSDSFLKLCLGHSPSSNQPSCDLCQTPLLLSSPQSRVPRLPTPESQSTQDCVVSIQSPAQNTLLAPPVPSFALESRSSKMSISKSLTTVPSSQNDLLTASPRPHDEFCSTTADLSARLDRIESTLNGLLTHVTAQDNHSTAIERWAKLQLRREYLKIRRQNLADDLAMCPSLKVAKKKLVDFLLKSTEPDEFALAIDTALDFPREKISQD